jgi:hypothetical protein
MKENEYLVIILQSNETLALKKNKWNYLLTKGWRNSDVPFERIQ